MKIKVGFFSILSVFVMSFGYVAKADFRPPGTAEVVDNFFYDVNEITNQDWREYVSYQKVNEGIDSKQYLNALPDTMVWKQEESYMDPYIQNYYSHPSYSNYPVVGVSQKQASDYCTWRTKAVKMMLKANDFKGPKDFSYRLPSKTEWELMANAGYGKKELKILQKKQREQLKNSQQMRVADVNMKLKPKTEAEKERDVIFFGPAPAKSYLPNKYGIFNINGNVAEMVQEEGVAMGGSYDHFYEDIIPTNAKLTYSQPQRWLGFRCVCEVSHK